MKKTQRKVVTFPIESSVIPDTPRLKQLYESSLDQQFSDFRELIVDTNLLVCRPVQEWITKPIDGYFAKQELFVPMSFKYCMHSAKNTSFRDAGDEIVTKFQLDFFSLTVVPVYCSVTPSGRTQIFGCWPIYKRESSIKFGFLSYFDLDAQRLGLKMLSGEYERFLQRNYRQKNRIATVKLSNFGSIIEPYVCKKDAYLTADTLLSIDSRERTCLPRDS